MREPSWLPRLDLVLSSHLESIIDTRAGDVVGGCGFLVNRDDRLYKGYLPVNHKVALIMRWRTRQQFTMLQVFAQG